MAPPVVGGPLATVLSTGGSSSTTATTHTSTLLLNSSLPRNPNTEPEQSKKATLLTLPTEVRQIIVKSVCNWEPAKEVREGEQLNIITNPSFEPKVFGMPPFAMMRTCTGLQNSLSDLLRGAQLIRLESPKICILGIVLASGVPLVCYGNDARDFPSKFLAGTHQIKTRPEAGQGLHWSGSPWGLSPRARSDLVTAERTKFPQPYIIRRQDLARFCRGLQAANSGFRDFGRRTRHRVTLYDAATRGLCGPPNFVAQAGLAEDSQRIANIYSEHLTGFRSFTVETSLEMMSLNQAAVSRQDPRALIDELTRKHDNIKHLLDERKYREASDMSGNASQNIMQKLNRGEMEDLGWLSHREALGQVYVNLWLLRAEAITARVFSHSSQDRDLHAAPCLRSADPRPGAPPQSINNVSADTRRSRVAQQQDQASAMSGSSADPEAEKNDRELRLFLLDLAFHSLEMAELAFDIQGAAWSTYPNKEQREKGAKLRVDCEHLVDREFSVND